MDRKSSFPPVVAPDTRVLILGSLPGEASLAARRYYAHPSNQFWRLAGAVLDGDLASLDYQARLVALQARGIGLWDVVASAQRQGSLDGALREVAGNPLAALVASLPELQAIAFNGGTAARIGRRLLGPVAPMQLDLPSSSAAYTLPFAAKRERWITLREFLRRPPDFAKLCR
ncbi:MAG: DNA-deoxyinosine glycosylase [Novosphingobium sp.]